MLSLTMIVPLCDRSEEKEMLVSTSDSDPIGLLAHPMLWALGQFLPSTRALMDLDLLIHEEVSALAVIGCTFAKVSIAARS